MPRVFFKMPRVFFQVFRGVSRGVGAGAKCTKLSWCKGDIRVKDNLRA